MKFWKIEGSWIGWGFGVIIPLFISLLFFNYVMPVGVLFAGLSVVFLFFLGLNYYTTAWVNFDYRQIEWRLFFISFIIRVFFLTYLYLLTYLMAPGSFPFEIHAADSWVYHNVSLILADAPFSEWLNILNLEMKSQSDFGYPIFQGLIYSFFGANTVYVRLINAVMGSITVVLLGRIVRLNWSDNHAKITGVVAMLFPSLVWYCGIQIKETLLVFVIVFLFYILMTMRAKGKWNAALVLLSFLMCFGLFFFRTFLAVLMFLSILLMFIPINRKGLASKNFIWVIALVGMYLFYSLVASAGLFDDINRQANDSEDFFSRNLEAEKGRLGNVQFNQVALAPLIIGGAIITPFPSYLYTEERQLPIFTRFQNELIRNMMYFFLYIGLFFVFKSLFKEYLSIIFFLFSYLGVITAAANSFQARFHMPIIPLVIIFIGIGIAEGKGKINRYWIIYLMLIFLAHLMWTYYKLDIRGIND